MSLRFVRYPVKVFLFPYLLSYNNKKSSLSQIFCSYQSQGKKKKIEKKKLACCDSVLYHNIVASCFRKHASMCPENFFYLCFVFESELFFVVGREKKKKWHDDKMLSPKGIYVVIFNSSSLQWTQTKGQMGRSHMKSWLGLRETSSSIKQQGLSPSLRGWNW